MSDFEVRDSDGRPLSIGAQVLYGSPPDSRLREAFRIIRCCLRGPHRVYYRQNCWRSLWALRLTREDYIAHVVAISEPDVDYDDELGRPVQYPPRVLVRFRDGGEAKVETEDVTKITWADYPDGPACQFFDADDLILL